MPDPWTLFLMVVFGAVGLGYFIYGKKRGKPIALVSGLTLMIYPYFVTGRLAMVLVGLVLALIPFIVR
jgi:hypothetical protein